MTYKGFYRGDDTFYYRLLSLLEKKFSIKINDIRRIRKNVFLIKSNDFWFILKGYSSYRKLKVQETFTKALEQEGFIQTYQFYVHDEPIIIDNMIYGCIQYLYPNRTAFTYKNEKHRKEALLLLTHFYSVTEHLVNIYQYILPPFRIMDKWQMRKDQFLRNKELIEKYIDPFIVKEIVSFAEQSLNNGQNSSEFFQSKPKVVLHGDVAHHNFLRDVNGQLFLIDFDLISIGPAVIDYLQYANRILPHMDWSFEELEGMPVFSELLQEETFLSYLLFPTDILREWNRFFRQWDGRNPESLQQVIHLTLDQYKKRKKFYDKVKRLIKE